jgi:hypothetical protein
MGKRCELYMDHESLSHVVKPEPEAKKIVGTYQEL